MSQSAPSVGRCGWFDERLGVSAALDFLRHKTVPVHRALALVLLRRRDPVPLRHPGGNRPAAALLLQARRRRPPTRACSSSSRQVSVRLADSLAAQLVGEPDGLRRLRPHVQRVLHSKAYRPPRELTWLTGMALLGLTLGFGFSGYLLPWNELAFFATKVGTDIVGSVPGRRPRRCCAPARRRRRHAGRR